MILFHRNSASKQSDIKRKTTILHHSPSIQVVHTCLCAFTPKGGHFSHNWFNLYEKWKLQMHWGKTLNSASASFVPYKRFYFQWTVDTASSGCVFLVINYKQKPINFNEGTIFWMQQGSPWKNCHSQASHTVGGRSLGFATRDFKCPGKMNELFSQATLCWNRPFLVIVHSFIRCIFSQLGSQRRMLFFFPPQSLPPLSVINKVLQIESLKENF